MRDWGGEGRGRATPFPSSHSLIKVHLLIDQLKLSKSILGSEAGRSKVKEMNYSTLNLNNDFSVSYRSSSEPSVNFNMFLKQK